MLNLFQHLICLVNSIRYPACPVGCRNKFSMTSLGLEKSDFLYLTQVC